VSVTGPWREQSLSDQLGLTTLEHLGFGASWFPLRAMWNVAAGTLTPRATLVQASSALALHQSACILAAQWKAIRSRAQGALVNDV